jgi:hypothetical protein
MEVQRRRALIRHEKEERDLLKKVEREALMPSALS